MREYAVLRLDVPLPRLAGRVFLPEEEPFCRQPYAPIDSYVWPGDYRPPARAWMAWDATGLHVLLSADEPSIQCAAKAFNGKVWCDSCLECFIRPLEDDPRYMNIEINAEGTALIAIGADRHDRRFLDALPDGMDIQTTRHDGRWWAVTYTIPFALLERLYGRAPAPGGTMYGNFYCCDETIHPHFGSWNPIDSPTPDFHRPDCFGLLRLTP